MDFFANKKLLLVKVLLIALPILMVNYYLNLFNNPPNNDQIHFQANKYD